MDDVLCAELPADLADELIGKGFEEFVPFRGFLTEAGTVMTLASTGLAVGANIATILVSREELGEFVAAIRDWVRGKTPSQPTGELAIDVLAKQGGEETRIQVKVVSKNGVSQIDAAALTAFVASLFPDELSAAGDVTSTPN